MKLNPRELRQQRSQLVQQVRGIINAAEQANREMTAEERSQVDSLMTQVDNISADIARVERIETAERSAEGTVAGRPDPNIGMSQSEIQQYSLVRAIRAAADAPRNPRAWDDAGLEAEASRAVAQRLGRDPQGFFVPYDWMNSRSVAGAERRDLTKGTNADGGYTVGTVLDAGSFIEMLRNRMVVRSAGARMLTGLVGDVSIPKQTGGATAYWVAESGAPTESQQTVGQLTLAPKTVGAFTDISRKLLKQSSIDVEMFVREDLATVIALALDLAALHGTGQNNQPTGIAATTGIGSVAGGTNGLAPTLAHIIGLETEVSVDNADLGRLAYITNAKVRGKLKQTPRVASTDSQMIWGEGNTPLNGYAAYVSNQVSAALTKGSSNVCSAIFFGNWADLIIAMWGGLDVLVDPYTGGTSGTVRVNALQDTDVAVRHAESFAAMLDALTA